MSCIESLIVDMRNEASARRCEFVRLRKAGSRFRDKSHSVAWIVIPDAKHDNIKQRGGKKYIALPDLPTSALRECAHILVFRAFAQRLYEVRIMAERDGLVVMQVMREHNLNKETRSKSIMPRNQPLIMELFSR